MLVKMLVSRAGLDFSQNRGDVVDIEDAEALRMIAAEQAELVQRQAVRETAVPKGKATEKAVS